jgi:Ser/Thr protein kinase RdoA (MazF antagonist)
MSNNIFSFPTLESPAPRLSLDDAQQAASTWFSDIVDLEPLDSERDQNFLATNKKQQQYVLKIANSKESFDVLDFQNQALNHLLKSSPSLLLPRVCQDLSGKEISSIVVNNNQHYVRLLSFIKGVPLEDSTDQDRPDVLHRMMGGFLAKLGKGLEGFSHPSSGHELLWDVKQAGFLYHLLSHIKDKHKRDIARASLERFTKNTEPKIQQLRSQVIHNDMNQANVILDFNQDGLVLGMIDFGDMVYAPLVNDLAVAAAYQTIATEDLTQGTVHLLSGYQQEYPLNENELALLPALITNRITMTVIIGEWRGAQHPENKQYILGGVEKSWRILEELCRLNLESAAETFIKKAQSINLEHGRKNK